VWGLALAAIVAQTVRHMVDTWYGALQDTATRALPVVSLGSRSTRSDSGPPLLEHRAAETVRPEAPGRAPVRNSASFPLPHMGVTAPRVLAQTHCRPPIGDRWLLMALAIAIGGPRVMFIVLLIAIAIAFAYVLAGRTLRALFLRVAVMPRFDIGFQRDDGPIARALGALGRVARRRCSRLRPGLSRC